ncbi:D-alanine-D-alanine ligase [Brachionus plicatilis]|uniref:D-alanine-D-alanine ligase n=1 Tax=Brachionus plicatilis TaxID=10195 RepID=A0A3M7SZG0_BRAPC|nr:D-alanine-D-alanine ligase [Brachionus plicatilis]
MQIENFGSENSDFYSSNYHFGIISEACELDTKIELSTFIKIKLSLGDVDRSGDTMLMVYLCKEKTWAHNYFDDWIDADHENLINIEETSKRVLEYEKKIHSKFNAIFTYDDYSILVASYLANHFNLPSIPFELAKTIKNKILCEKNGITFPNFFLIKNHEIDPYTKLNGKLDNIFSLPLFKNSKIEFPLIVKNPNGSGKDFIYKCNNITKSNLWLFLIIFQLKNHLLMKETNVYWNQSMNYISINNVRPSKFLKNLFVLVLMWCLSIDQVILESKS